jgi:seryl-tRNA synthetase
MIDLHDLRANPEAYREACRKKRIKFDIDGFLKVDEEYRALKTSVEALRSEQNRFSKLVAGFKGDEKTQKLAEMKSLSENLKEAAAKFQSLEAEWLREQLRIPGIPLAEVPEGKDDTENKEIRKWGAVPKFNFEPKDHATLGKALDIIDIERGVKIAGARNYFLKNDGMRLSHAVMSLALDLLHKKGYALMDPPHIVSYEAMMATGYFPGGEEMAYHLDARDEGLYLIGTSEVSVASYHKDELLAAEMLPLRYAGYSPCYRREAGTYGKDTQGLYRVHQFYKVEQVIISRADAKESAELHNELLANAEELLQILEIPYRVVIVCSGDMGQGQVWKHDIESWMPSRKAYGETHSCSSFYDFQARRLNLRYKQDGKNSFCYTLNNTLIASPRVLIPLLELNQQPDGKVKIPKALQPYLGGQEVIG